MEGRTGQDGQKDGTAGVETGRDGGKNRGGTAGDQGGCRGPRLGTERAAAAARGGPGPAPELSSAAAAEGAGLRQPPARGVRDQRPKPRGKIPRLTFLGGTQRSSAKPGRSAVRWNSIIPRLVRRTAARARRREPPGQVKSAICLGASQLQPAPIEPRCGLVKQLQGPLPAH